MKWNSVRRREVCDQEQVHGNSAGIRKDIRFREILHGFRFHKVAHGLVDGVLSTDFYQRVEMDIVFEERYKCKSMPPDQGLRPAPTTLGRFNSCACSATCYGQCGMRVITRENFMASYCLGVYVVESVVCGISPLHRKWAWTDLTAELHCHSARGCRY